MLASYADAIPDWVVIIFLLSPVVLIITAFLGLHLMLRSKKPVHHGEYSLHDQIQFLAAIDQLKHVLRQSPVSGLSRKENTAEHSWHVAMYAAVLARSVRPEADLARVLKMLLVHDIVEIEAGDTPLHGDQSARAGQPKRELEAAENLFGILPVSQGEEFLNIWKEFEQGRSAEAQLAKALDRLQPVIQNLNNSGGTWTENQVTREQIFERCGPDIAAGSPELWDYAKSLIEAHYVSPNPGKVNLPEVYLGLNLDLRILCHTEEESRLPRLRIVEGVCRRLTTGRI